MCDISGVHLIGSVALPDRKAVFTNLSSSLGPWLKRLPDGETGQRSRWIYWQREMLMQHPDFELAANIPGITLHEWDGQFLRTLEYIRLKPGIDPAGVTIECGYAEAAKESYKQFIELRNSGTIPRGVRFQVSLPTPMASGYMYIAPDSLSDYLAIYESALLADLAEIVNAIPHHDLSIQWDVCQEVLVWEGYPPFRHRPDDFKSQISDELARLGNAVPAGVELGYHLCYATPADRHLVMPTDTGVMVEMTQLFAPKLSRPMNFLHLPVPKDRTDEAYFKPLKHLNLAEGTDLYLGLIHFDDRMGDQARIKTASQVVADFGVSTECGWGRTKPERVPDLIAAHREAMKNNSRTHVVV
ncbi:MAG: hypothetical protein KDA48_06140 [Amphiplicatus sp.]|nr:hypothetical protein [Amphiplicatus sp.]MCB9954867.1 hypothetical protein [Caulobacterales bacterium]